MKKDSKQTLCLTKAISDKVVEFAEAELRRGAHPDALAAVLLGIGADLLCGSRHVDEAATIIRDLAEDLVEIGDKKTASVH